jgi:hypothetical protein
MRSLVTSVAEPPHFAAALARGKNVDAAPALAPVPTLLCSQPTFVKSTKVNISIGTVY